MLHLNLLSTQDITLHHSHAFCCPGKTHLLLIISFLEVYTDVITEAHPVSMCVCVCVSRGVRNSLIVLVNCLCSAQAPQAHILSATLLLSASPTEAIIQHFNSNCLSLFVSIHISHSTYFPFHLVRFCHPSTFVLSLVPFIILSSFPSSLPPYAISQFSV